MFSMVPIPIHLSHDLQRERHYLSTKCLSLWLELVCDLIQLKEENRDLVPLKQQDLIPLKQKFGI